MSEMKSEKDKFYKSLRYLVYLIMFSIVGYISLVVIAGILIGLDAK